MPALAEVNARQGARRGTPRHATARDERLIAALLTGHSVPHAAEEAGVPRRTAYRRLDDPAFQSKLEAARQEIISRAVRAASNLAPWAVATLGTIMQNAAMPPAVRVSAARTLLDRVLLPTDFAAGDVEVESPGEELLALYEHTRQVIETTLREVS